LTAGARHDERHVDRVAATAAPRAAEPHERRVLDLEVLESRYRERASPTVAFRRLRMRIPRAPLQNRHASEPLAVSKQKSLHTGYSLPVLGPYTLTVRGIQRQRRER